MMAVCQRFTALIATIVSLSAIFTVSAHAFEVQPMRHHVFPANGQSAGQFSVTNPRSTALPVEIVVLKRTYDENGDIVLVDAEDDFLVFPVQTLIEPDKSQAFRFQYLGDPDMVEEAAYTIDVREVPVTLPDDFTGVRVVYNFGVVVYLEKPDTDSELKLSANTRTETALQLRIENPTTSFARLSNDTFVLKQGAKTVELEGSDLKGRVDKIVLAPMATSTLTLDLDGLEFGAGDISVLLYDESE